MNRLARYAVALAVGSGAWACSADPAPTPTAPKFSAIHPLIFPRATKAQCSYCHGLPPNEKSNGNLSTGADEASAYRALVGAKSTSAKCLGKSYVVPGRPEESLLLSKVTTPTCGDRMPLGGDPLTEDQITMIREWIAAGAKED